MRWLRLHCKKSQALRCSQPYCCLFWLLANADFFAMVCKLSLLYVKVLRAVTNPMNGLTGKMI
jgi:hypothetical protein